MTRFQLVVPGLMLAACGGGSTVIEPPPPPADEFTLTLKADPEDASSAQALGWTAGIPETDVTLTPKAPATGAPQTHRTSAVGKIVIAKLPAADYLVEARRILTDTERGRLAAGDDAVGFVVKSAVRIAAGRGQEVVSAPASRRRSLVISEFSNNELDYIDEAYQDNAYVELHNNADTTVYLDGMLLARAIAPTNDHPNFPCALYNPGIGFDPQGVWARWMVQFPGTGRDFPVPPGGTIVAATDAIDHSVIVPGGLDLRAAQFEILGIADVDNPTVPNMIDAGDSFTGFTGHGLNWQGLIASVTVLARPTPPGLLLPGILPGGGTTPIWRIPAERILDVLSLHGTFISPSPNCPYKVHTNFDRAKGVLFYGDEFAMSGQRRVILVLPGGRKILQHTRSTDADFFAAVRSPGVLP